MTKARSIFLSGNTTEEEQEYFRLIDEIAGKQESRIISNGRPAHAVYLLYKFFHCARHKIGICTGRLLQELPGKTDSVLAYADPALARAAIHFLGRENTELSIIVADKDGLDTDGQPESHPFLKAASGCWGRHQGNGDGCCQSERSNGSVPLPFSGNGRYGSAC